jgi:hypothetical protein
MQEIITEILERHGFPTKNVEELVTMLEPYSLEELVSLTIITTEDEIVGLSLGNKPRRRQGMYCSLGSELVARLKGGE